MLLSLVFSVHVLVIYLIIVVCACVLTSTDGYWNSFWFYYSPSGNFEWNPSSEYVGGEGSTMANVDPNLLSHFEIQDLCVEAGGPINSRIYYLIPGGDLE